MAGHQHEVEETLKRLNAHRGVLGIMVMNADGLPIKSTMESTLSVQYAGLLTSLCVKCRSIVKDLDSTNDLTFLRIRTCSHEIMVAPDKEYTLVVVQTPTD